MFFFSCIKVKYSFADMPPYNLLTGIWITRERGDEKFYFNTNVREKTVEIQPFRDRGIFGKIRYFRRDGEDAADYILPYDWAFVLYNTREFWVDSWVYAIDRVLSG